MDVQQQKLDTEVQDKARLYHLDKQYNFTSSTSVGLAGFREFSKFANDGWIDFQEYRKSCLSQGLRFGVTPEKASENILERFFVQILGWPVSGLSWQVDHADLVLSNNFYKYLIVEVKRPGQLNTPARWRKAIHQARGYASRQGVSKIAVSDGTRMYAADCGEYGLIDRVNTRLDTDAPDLDALWWLSFYGIHQHCANPPPGWELEEILTKNVDTDFDEEYVLTYKGLPSWCFAYVGDIEDTGTWKLPYRLPDGQVDTKRLPKALSALLGTFRGKKVQGIPERALPSVYEALYRGVVAADKVPGLDNPVSPVYWQFAEAIKQIRQSVGNAYAGN